MFHNLGLTTGKVLASIPPNQMSPSRIRRSCHYPQQIFHRNLLFDLTFRNKHEQLASSLLYNTFYIRLINAESPVASVLFFVNYNRSLDWNRCLAHERSNDGFVIFLP